MSSKKLTPDEELEKQYNDYKAQFEEWKERNKESVGTDAYMRYVKQFEDWEKGVQRQRLAIRQKTEEETRRKAEAEKVARRRQEEAEAAAQRAAEQNRIANRQRRLVAAAAASTAATAAAERQQEPVLLHRQPSATSVLPTAQVSAAQPPNDSDSPLEASSMANVMQQMMNFVRDSEKQNGAEISQEVPNDRSHSHHRQQTTTTQVASYSTHQEYQHVVHQQHHQSHQQPSTYSHQPTVGVEPATATISSVLAQPATVVAAAVVQPQQQAPLDAQAPPQLWGGEGASYSLNDPMFRRWNVRAAPPNFCVPYEPPPTNVVSTPYWMLVEKMREHKLVLAPSFNMLPQRSGTAMNGSNQSPNKPQSMFGGSPMPQPPIGMSPLFRPPAHAPPPFHPHAPPYHHMGGEVRPPAQMYNVPPPNFRMPPPAAAAAITGGPPSFYKSN